MAEPVLRASVDLMYNLILLTLWYEQLATKLVASNK